MGKDSFIKVFLVFGLLLLAIAAVAQKTNNIWYFGRGAGLDFNFSPPKPIKSDVINTGEGCSSVSDENGNLLFYTDGRTVWTSNHKIMLNGKGLKGNSSSTQSSIVVKKPSSENLYYLFNAGINEGFESGLHYSVIDMSADNGKGEVVTKNFQLMQDSASEKIAIVKADFKCGYWVIAHGEKNNEFYSYFLDETGLNPNPIVSATGHDYSTSKATVGYLKASPEGTMLAAALYLTEGIEIYDFDKTTGVVSNSRLIDSTSGRYYGCAFSPNGKYLYFGTLDTKGSIFQFDVTSGDKNTIINSRKTIAINLPYRVGAFQEGPDGKMYIIPNGKNYLAVIENPNAPTGSIVFKQNAITMLKQVVWGLPSFINGNDFLFSKEIDLGADTLVCGASFPLNSGLNSNSKFIWSTGDTTPSITATQNGLYWVKASSKCWGESYDSINVLLLPDTLQKVALGVDTSICGVDYELTSNITQNIKHLWSTGDTTKTITATANGNYKLTVSDLCYSNSDDINITFIKDTLSGINLGVDTLVCEKTYELKVPDIDGGIYKWNTGDTIPNITVSEDGVYNVSLFTPVCNNRYDDSIVVNFYETKPLILKPDTTICSKNFREFSLAVNEDYTSYLWSTGSTENTAKIFAEGNYSLTTKDTCNITYTKNIQVTVCNCELYVPTSFTPNNDGTNDVFYITNDCGFAKYSLKVFNRWGTLLFETDNPTKVWNGTYKGEAVPDGVYLVSLRYNHNGDTRSPDYKGTLTLMR